MKTYKLMYGFYKKVLPAFLCAVMLINISTEALAQSVSLQELQAARDKELGVIIEKRAYEMRNDKRLADTRWAQVAWDKANQMEKNFKENGDVFYKAQLKDPVFRRAEEIKYLILGKDRQPSSQEEASIMSFADFKAEYAKALNKEAATAAAQLKADQAKQSILINTMAEEYLKMGQHSEADIAEWQKKALADLVVWGEESAIKINTAKREELAKAQAKYNDYKTAAEKAQSEAEAAAFAQVQKLAVELISLYASKPDLIKRYIVELTPMLSVVRINGQKIFNEKQEDFLLRVYRRILETENEVCKKGYSCEIELNAINGLGMLSNQLADANLIRKFIEDHTQHPAYVQILLTGVSAMLTMKEYDPISVLILSSIQKESEVGNFDFLSFTAPVEAFATMRGKYLGEVSKYAQYTEAEGVVLNAWTDVALMLAQEGSERSLEMLREFGVEKCAVFVEKDLKLNNEYSLRCGGILPFTAGALLSGKSGADRYSQKASRAGEQAFEADGRVSTVTIDQAQASLRRKTAFEANFKGYAKQLGLSPAAMVALEILNQGMGDISAHAERALDTDLYEKFKNEYTGAQVGHYAVIDSGRYSAKVNRQRNVAMAKDIATLGDIAFTVWCMWDLSRLAYKGIRGLSRLGNQIYRGMAVARIGTVSARNAYIRGHINAFRGLRAKEIAVANFTAKVKGAMAPIVESQRALYTSMPLPSAKLLPESGAVANALKTATYSAETGALTINAKAAYEASTGVSNRVLDIQNTKRALEQASSNAVTTFSERGVFTKFLDKKFKKDYSSYLSKEITTSFTSETAGLGKAFGRASQNAALDFAAGVKSDKNIAFMVKSKDANELNMVSFREGAQPNSKTLELFYDNGIGEGIALPVEIAVPGKIPGVNTKKLSSVLLSPNTEKKADWWLKFVTEENKFIDPAFFKIAIDSKSMPNFVRTAAKTEDLAELTLKFLPEEKGLGAFAKSVISGSPEVEGLSNWYHFHRPDFFRTKAGLYGGKGMVFLREGGALKPTNINLMTYKRYDGVKVVLENNNTFTVLSKEGNLLKTPYGFSLPKNQIGGFMKVMPDVPFDNPVGLSLLGGTNKMNSLFFITAISLSAASTGLVGPLKKAYPNMSVDKMLMISIVLPYASSFLSPFIAPFVKRFGAINVLKTSMVTSVASLAFPAFLGFHGFGDITSHNDNKPDTWPLYISAGLIGLSSALTRSSLNPLTKALGGATNRLKSMAYKSVSGVAMLVPPLVTAGADYVWPRYYTLPDGSMEMKDGKPVVKSYTDFSLAYPVLGAASLGALGMLQASRLSKGVGRLEGYHFTKGVKGLSETGKIGRYVYGVSPLLGKGTHAVLASGRTITAESWGAFRGLGNKAVLPVTLAATAALGAEAALVNSYSMAEANNYVESNLTSNKAFIPVIATVALSAAPFVVRYNSKAILNLLGGEKNPMAYKRLIVGSLGMAGAGGAMLATQDNWGAFAAGMALTAAGFASTTNTFLEVGSINLKAAKAAKSAITSFEVVYPGVHIGMSVLPKVYGSVVDKDVKAMGFDDKTPEGEKAIQAAKRTVMQEKMWIPLTALGASAFFGFKGIGMMPKSLNFRVPQGTIGMGKLIFGDFSTPFNTKPGLANPLQPLGAEPVDFLKGYKAPQPEVLENGNAGLIKNL